MFSGFQEVWALLEFETLVVPFLVTKIFYAYPWSDLQPHLTQSSRLFVHLNLLSNCLTWLWNILHSESSHGDRGLVTELSLAWWKKSIEKLSFVESNRSNKVFTGTEVSSSRFCHKLLDWGRWQNASPSKYHKIYHSSKYYVHFFFKIIVPIFFQLKCCAIATLFHLWNWLIQL